MGEAQQDIVTGVVPFNAASTAPPRRVTEKTSDPSGVRPPRKMPVLCPACAHKLQWAFGRSRLNTDRKARSAARAKPVASSRMGLSTAWVTVSAARQVIAIDPCPAAAKFLERKQFGNVDF